MLKSILCALLSIIAIFTNVSSMFSTVKAPADGGIRVEYGDGSCESMDVYIPENAVGEKDVVLLIHGGAWLMGDQTEYSEYAKTIADEYGYVAVTMDYGKLSNNITAADMVNEIYEATQSIVTTLAEYNLTADKMAVIGHSAGAHLALLYSYSHYNDSPIDIGFVMSNCAPSDFFNGEDGTTTVEKFSYILASAMTHDIIAPWTIDNAETKKLLASITPYSMVTSEVPPTIVVHGGKDEMVPYSNSVQLYEKLQECGVKSTFITYPDCGHFLETNDEMDIVRADAFFEYAELYL